MIWVNFMLRHLISTSLAVKNDTFYFGQLSWVWTNNICIMCLNRVCCACRTSSVISLMMVASWSCPTREITGKRYIYFVCVLTLCTRSGLTWSWFDPMLNKGLHDIHTTKIIVSDFVLFNFQLSSATPPLFPSYHRLVFSLEMWTRIWCMRSTTTPFLLVVRPFSTSLHVNQSAAATRAQQWEASLW